jgi:hypothetical protein
MSNKTKRRITNILFRGKKLREQMRKKFPSPDDLRKGDVIRILNPTRLCGLDKKAELIRKLKKDEVVIYKGRAKNQLWSNDNVWIKLATMHDEVGIVLPISMVNNFEYVED